MGATTPDPFAAKVETGAEDAAYTAWLRAKLREAELDAHPGIAHDEVMTMIAAKIKQAMPGA